MNTSPLAVLTLSPWCSGCRPKRATYVITTDAASVLIWGAGQQLGSDARHAFSAVRGGASLGDR